MSTAPLTIDESTITPLAKLEPAPTNAAPTPSGQPLTIDESTIKPLTELGSPSTSTSDVVRGEVKNDVGNTVIVPKEGEDFADTMRRAAAQGKKTTPEQIQAEEKTMPGKAATVLAAAPAIGAVGSALDLAGTTAIEAAPSVMKEISRQALEYADGKAEVANEALAKFRSAYPELSKLVTKLGFGKTAGTLGLGYGSWELFKHITGLGK
jgi:hypothetical protein